MCGGFVAAGFGIEFLLFWVVPFVTIFPIVNWYLELFEHYLYVGREDLDVRMTRNRWLGFPFNWPLGILNENYHATHHLCPQVPWFNIPRAHRVLMQDTVYREAQCREAGLILPVIEGVPSIISAVLEGNPRSEMS